MRLSICFAIDSVPFTVGVIDGSVSLGGSESACLGLARALQRRGHDVHLFVTKLSADAPSVDAAGVTWHPAESIAQWSLLKDWDVAIALRQPMFLQHVQAKYRVLWSQDLMAGDPMKQYVMSLAWAYDAVAYVSAYHQRQWEATTPELTGIGWAAKNGHDAALAATARAEAVKKPHQIIHISRPERGLAPLLMMWPALKAARPDAELVLCRYSSMYDKDGWGEVCKAFDRDVADVNAAVGGITYLGELGKPALYRAIAESAVMWYPGVSTFAETSCIAAIEAQACGTPFVGSYKGALPETVPAGVLVPGVAEDDAAYQAASVAAVVAALDGCEAQSFAYRSQVKAGLAHVAGYSYEAVAAEWEDWLLGQFAGRYTTDAVGVMRRLVHEDDFVSAALVADELLLTPHHDEAQQVKDDFAAIAAGREHTADGYAEQAMDPRAELQRADLRIKTVVEAFTGCQHILDVACGSGAYALALALDHPTRHVTAVDYAAGNIAAGRAAAEALGVADRITWVVAPVWDMEAQRPSDWLAAQATASYDGLYCGEFLEHVADCTAFVTALDRLVRHQGRVVYTCPQGALNSLLPRDLPLRRGHVHHFRPADLQSVFGQKEALRVLSLPWTAQDGRGQPVGNWCIGYRRGQSDDTGRRPLGRRLLARPYARLSVGLITNDTTDLRRCLDAVWLTADEIVLGDCGCVPSLLAAVLAEFPRKVRVVPVGDVRGLDGGFSEARNVVLAAATGEWFLWIDSDEVLVGARDLGKYLDGVVFRGYALRQNHLHLDGPMSTDTPVRVFRRGPDIQFYGCIHEQPQMGDANGDITPALELADVQIAHTGYLHESVRRDKALTRNLPLLVRDQQRFPERELGKLLVLRDYANLALWTKEQQRGQVTPQVQEYYGAVIGLFESRFMDQTHKYHALARPFYEQALRHVKGAFHVELGVVAAHAPDGLGAAHVTPQRAWVRTADHLKALIAARTEAMLTPTDVPWVLDCEPLAPVREREAVSA